MEAALSEWEIVGRLCLAALLGATVGIEREAAGQDAGFRTHLLLSLGAALFGVVSVGAFDEFIVSSTTRVTNVTVDVTRIASYVAAGVGFIGGGVILKQAGTVRGITTAASLWSAAAIGLSAGVGFWVGAVTATVLSLVALSALKPISSWASERQRPARSVLVVVEDLECRFDVVRAVEELVGTPTKSVRLGGNDDQTHEVAVEFWNSIDPTHHSTVVEGLHRRFGADVRSITIET